MRYDMIEVVARDLMGRPDAHLGSVESLNHDRDGFDGVRVELVDAPACLSGKRKGQPNWRKATNRQTRLISAAEMGAAVARWVERTGLCPDCTGTGRTFVRWHIDEGVTYEPCVSCDGSTLAEVAR